MVKKDEKDDINCGDTSITPTNAEPPNVTNNEKMETESAK